MGGDVDPAVPAGVIESGIDMNSLGHAFIRAIDPSTLTTVTPFHFRAWVLRPGDTELNLSHERSARLIVASLPTSIDTEEQLSMLLGWMVIEHAALHHKLSELWSAFTGPSPANRLVPDRFAQLISDCRVMLPAVSALADLGRADAAAEALQFASDVNRRRNAMVHEMWVSADAHSLLFGSEVDEGEQRPDFFRHRVPRKPKELSSDGPLHTVTAANLDEVALAVCDTILARSRLAALAALIDRAGVEDVDFYRWADVSRSELLLGAYHGTVVDDWLRGQRFEESP